MGRRKIAIKRIADNRRRYVTYSRRKMGLMKKAYELSVLADCDVGLVMINGDKVTLYSNRGMENIIRKYNQIVVASPGEVEQYGDVQMAHLGDEGPGGMGGGDEDEDDEADDEVPVEMFESTDAKEQEMKFEAAGKRGSSASNKRRKTSASNKSSPRPLRKDVNEISAP